MGLINFKSVGTTKQNQIANELVKTPTPIGIRTPLRLSENNGLFVMNYSLADQIHDNLRNLILTNWGERLGLYDFGANLKPLLSEFTNQEGFDAEAVSRINTAVTKFMPYISLENFLSTVDRKANASSSGTAVINIIITYNIPTLKIQQRALELTLYVM